MTQHSGSWCIISPKALWKRLVERIGDNVSGIASAISVACLTAGFAVLIWAADKASAFYANLARFLIFVGVFALVVALELLRREQKKRDREHSALLDEIKGLRGDLREKGTSGKAEQGEEEK